MNNEFMDERFKEVPDSYWYDFELSLWSPVLQAKGKEINEDRDHHFTDNQKAEYDSLNAKGRTAYDLLRWFGKATHEEAFRAGRVLDSSRSTE